MYYVLIILVAAGIIIVEYNHGDDLQTKNDTLEQQLKDAQSAAASSDSRLQALSDQDQKRLQDVTTQNQKIISDLRSRLSDIAARPVISIPPLVVRQAAPVQVAIPPPPPPPGPKIDPDVLRKQLDVLNSKIADLNQDLEIQGKDLARESGYSTVVNGNGYIENAAPASHGAASQKMRDDHEQLADLERQKAAIKDQLAQLPASGTAEGSSGFDPGTMNDTTVAH
jgi:hypothetical protein